MYSVRLILILCLIFFLIIINIAASENLFNSDPIALTSILKYPFGKSKFPIRLDELYSDKLGRAVIRSSNDQYAYADRSEPKVFTLKGPLDISSYWRSVLYGHYFFDILVEVLSYHQPPMVFGLARLVSLVRANSSKIKNDTINMRGILDIDVASIIYRLDIKYRFDDINFDFPQSITCYRDGKEFFEVEYFIWKQFDQFKYMRQGSRSFSTYLDTFTYPIGSGVSEHLPKLSISQDFSKRIVSFEASTITTFEDKILKHGINANLRDGLIKITETDQVREMTLILDQKRNVRLIVLEDLNKSNDKPKTCHHALVEHLSNESGRKGVELLFGTTSYAYMGDGVVRGSLVSIYEGSSDIPPFWLNRMIKRNLATYNIVLYAKHEAQTGDYLDLSNILLVEIYLITENDNALLYRSEIFGYILDFENFNEDGRLSEIFSPPSCYLETITDNLRNEFSFLYYEPNRGASSLFNDPVNRDLALMMGFADTLNIPVFSIVDLRSTVSQINDDNLRLNVNFRFAFETAKLKGISHYSGASLNPEFETVHGWRARTALECLAKFDSETDKQTEFFFFSGSKKICVIDRNLKTQSDLTDSNKMHKLAIRLSSQGKGDLYKVSDKILHPLELAFRTIRQNLNKLRGSLSIKGDAGKILKLKVDHSQTFIRESSRINRYMLNGLAYKPDTHIEKILIGNNFISFEHCETSCLENFNCRGFSYCNGMSSEVRCLISPKSLNSLAGGPTIEEQLLESKISIKERGSEVAIKTSSGEQILVRDRGCNTYKRQNIDMFSYSTSIERSTYGLAIIEVADIDECASRCFEINLREFNEIQRQASGIKDYLLTKSEPSEELNVLQEFSLKRRDHIHKLCDRFYTTDNYYGEANDIPQDKKILCAIKDEKETSSLDSNVIGKIDEYSFNFETLYQRRYDVILDTSINPNEYIAFKKANDESKLTQNELDSLRYAISNKKNYRTILDINSKDCARNCFIQNSQVWPSCASFDTLTVESGDILIERCFFNSVTLNSTDAVNINSKEGGLKTIVGQRVHWEPRYGIAKFDSEASAQLEIERESIWSALVGYYKKQTSHGWLIFLLILVGSVCGLLAGITLVRPVARYFRLKDGKETSELNLVMLSEQNPTESAQV